MENRSVLAQREGQSERNAEEVFPVLICIYGFFPTKVSLLTHWISQEYFKRLWTRVTYRSGVLLMVLHRNETRPYILYQLSVIAHRYTNRIACISSDCHDTCNRMMRLKVCFCWPQHLSTRKNNSQA
jgi:hypothetical protein